MSDSYEEIYRANGQLDADMIRVFLEAYGIQVLLAGESAGRVTGLTIGSMGEVPIFVLKSQAAQARELLDAMQRGDLEKPEPPAPE